MDKKVSHTNGEQEAVLGLIILAMNIDKLQTSWELWKSRKEETAEQHLEVRVFRNIRERYIWRITYTFDKQKHCEPEVVI